MFTDVVGSTERAAELGDAQWKKLLAAHNAAMRRLLKRHGGREVDTAGDGFFMTFDQPAHAIECALDMIDTLGAMGIHIRAGVHFGEVEVMDDKIAGMTVHIGARIMAQGGADELIVSSTVRDLMTGSDLPFDDRGFQQLKGVDSQWHLYGVAGRVRDREQITVGEPGPAVPPWRQPIVIGSAVAAIVAIAVAVFTLTRGDEAAVPAVNTIVRLEGGTVAAVVPVGSGPKAIAIQDTTLWVANSLDLTYQRVDTRADTAEPAEGGLRDSPTSMATGDGSVWIGSSLGSDDSLVRIDPTEQNSASTVALGGPVSGLATGSGSVWATDQFGDLIRRYNVATQEATELAPLPEGSGPTGIAWDGDTLWVALHGARQVAQVDPTTGEILASVRVEAGKPDNVAIGGGFVWVSVLDGDAILRIDPKDGSPFTIPGACDGPAGIAASDDGVWVACSLDGRVLHLDPSSGDPIDDVLLGAEVSPAAVAIATDGVWISLIGL